MKKLLLVTSIILAGCASNEPVPIGPDTYMISDTSMAMGASTADAQRNALKAANKHCASLGKEFLFKNISSNGPAPFSPPEAILYYMCLDKGDKDLRRPNIEKEADTIIKIK